MGQMKKKVGAANSNVATTQLAMHALIMNQDCRCGVIIFVSLTSLFLFGLPVLFFSLLYLEFRFISFLFLLQLFSGEFLADSEAHIGT